jgi:hypothetical protein
MLWWLIFDIFLFSTVSAYINDFYIPSLFASEVESAKHFFQSIVSSKDRSNTRASFNACEYLFVSHKVAKAFSELQASTVILGYSSPWPRRSYRSPSLSIHAAIASILMIILKVILMLPPYIQDEVSKGFLRLIALGAFFAICALEYNDIIQIALLLAITAAMLYLINVLVKFVSSTNVQDSARRAPLIERATGLSRPSILAPAPRYARQIELAISDPRLSHNILGVDATAEKSHGWATENQEFFYPPVNNKVELKAQNSPRPNQEFVNPSANNNVELEAQNSPRPKEELIVEDFDDKDDIYSGW